VTASGSGSGSVAAGAEFPAALGRLLAEGPVDVASVRAAFDAILAGTWTSVQIGAFAVALRMRGESPEVIVAAAEAMRAAMSAVDHGLDVVVDTCGTGGDGSQTLNLSSGAAVVVAACGLAVAKHGNRSMSSRCGSADVYESLGIPIDLPPARQHEVLRDAGITFLFAQAHHPALKHAAVARRELGTRTIFNALGPLANPARATHQLVGVYEERLRPIAARALARLGLRRAWVVRGDDGLDEVSPCGPTRVSDLGEDGEVRERVVTPEDFGIPRMERAAIAGGEAASNARALEAILQGRAHPARDAVVLNAAATLVIATAAEPQEAAERARAAIDGGSAWATLEGWRRAAQRVRGVIP
jgi:anthranilate phosphoribosyltransferase